MFKRLYALFFVFLFSGLAQADFISAERAFENHQYTEAFNEFYKLAQKGDYRAQYYVGKMYLEGLGTNKDDKKALEYIKNSADKRYDSAQALLGYLYEEGKILSQDKRKAVELYKEAANAGNSYAKLNLGLAYFRGDIITKDPQKAIELLSAVPIEAVPEIGRYLGEVYLSINDGKKAVDAYRASAREGDVDSFYSLGRIYFSTGEYATAKEYYTYAASQGNIPSQYLLGMMYINGKEIERDPYQGYAWLKMAADKNYEPAKEVKEELDEEMSRSVADRAKNEFLRIQNEVIGKVESPFIAEQKKMEEIAAAVAAEEAANPKRVRRRRR